VVPRDGGRRGKTYPSHAGLSTVTKRRDAPPQAVRLTRRGGVCYLPPRAARSGAARDVPVARRLYGMAKNEQPNRHARRRDRRREQPRAEAADARPGAAAPTLRRGTRSDLLVCAALFVGTFLLYLPSLFNDFVDFDDPYYVTENPVVRQGLTADGVRWAFTTNHFSNWLPVTWLSHMLDVQLWGLHPAGHHATSNLLHALNAALLFAFLRRATGAWRRPLIAAALFAAHPLRVESVSWIAERKDVLAATFFLLVLIAYVRYARGPRRRWTWFALAVVFDALGLMSKTMLVTVPGVLLLLDYWPLRRWTALPPDAPDGPSDFPRRSAGRLVAETLPFAALSAIASLWTYRLQQEGGAMRAGEAFTPGQRLANAFVSVPRYLEKLVHPVDLSAFYPHPGTWPAWQVIGSVALVAGLCAAAFAWRRRAPWAAVGWFWFLGMLVPVSGVVQVGAQSMADRYMYLPSIGLTVAVVWGLHVALGRVAAARRLATPVVAGVVAVLCAATLLQQRYWASTLDLFEHALIVDERNALAHEMVGTVYQAGGDDARAVEHLERAVELAPNRWEALNNEGLSLYRLGRTDEAIVRARRATEVMPDAPSPRLILSAALEQKGDYAAAAAEAGEAVRLSPQDSNAHALLGAALAGLGRRDDAARAIAEALRLNPNHGPAKKTLEKLQAPPRP
jgi:Flp pilus assembly protein TadD